MLHQADTHKNGFVPGGNKTDTKTSCDNRPGELLPLNKASSGKGDDKHDDGDVRVTIHENPLEEAAGDWDNSSNPQQQELEPLQQQQQQQPQTQVQQQQQQQQQQQEHVSWRGWRRSRAEKSLLGLVVLLVFAVLGLLLLLLLRPPYTDTSRICLTEECVKTAASLLEAMDQTADPCNDFFQFACGMWNRKHVIPEDRASINTFEVMADQLQKILRGLLQHPIMQDEGEATKKAKLFYSACMNTSQIEQTGDAPLLEVLESLGGWPVTTPNWTAPNFTVETLIGRLRGELNQGILIDQWVGPDDKNSSVNVIQLDQMVLGISSRDYFLRANSSLRALNAYLKFMEDVAVLQGADREAAQKELAEVLALEIRLANATMPEADRHDTGENYMKMSLAKLEQEVPEFKWTDYLSAFLDEDLSEDEPIVVYSMPYLKRLAKIMVSSDTRVLWNYVLWRLVLDMTQHLNRDYRARRHEFQKVLLGIQSDRNRWNLCIDWTNKRLGMAVGALFIKENFNPESKETALEMIHTLRSAFSDLLEENDWMDDETRTVAREKANAMNEKIGYPEMLTRPHELAKEYENLTIVENQHLQNIFNWLRYDATKNLGRLREDVNKSKWSTAPAVLNAFYNPNFNDIVFPAGILQPLFYSQHLPKSLNYGGIGVVIGHEMTHGFDDKGRQFDKEGNLKQWWNNRTIQAFRERAQCIIDQYSGYKVDQVDQFINGRMTQGENIADNGGIKQAYRAYRQWVERNGEEKLLPGIDLTHDQLFFLNYARIWCGTMRPEDALSKIRSSVHSLGPIRVLGPLSNSVDFARSYNCPVGSRMNPGKKCSVW
ncbi:neprilysin-1-like [Scylla paramamosain]|uniref:neprilysin-1-like n=1 Tax=Scylla paramamosain TaxID=85552 RepID=UPI0030838E35